MKYFLEDNFAPDSMALLYFDKKGVGESEGKWHKTTLSYSEEARKALYDWIQNTIKDIDNKE